ncbi:MAG: SDR family NAD(P)-dependent oxidoreductase [Bacteroidia bacterium]|nr:SDR family NAD(P)-dependent oxidoreductase [Bacteroidia bacterium]
MNLNDKNVLITGGSIGIGLELANQFSREGANVLICARNGDALDKAKRQNPALEVFRCDVTVKEQVEDLLHKAREVFDGVDILINNAAVFRRFDILGDYPLEKQFEEIHINLLGVIQVTDIFLKDLLARKDAMIVNLTSPAAFVPLAAAPIYSAVKAAVSSYTTSLRHQLRNTQLNVVLLCPPAVDTRMNKNNPGVEARNLMSPEKFARLSIDGIKKGRKEILIRPIGGLKLINRIAPGFAFRMLNPQ